MATTQTDEFKMAIHYARLIPLGKDSKKDAIHRWAEQIKKALAQPKGLIRG